MGKIKVLDFLNNDKNKTVCVLVVPRNDFAVNHAKIPQIYFLHVTCQARNDFPKDVERRVVIFRLF